jgi:hypothetical protein
MTAAASVSFVSCGYFRTMNRHTNRALVDRLAELGSKDLGNTPRVMAGVVQLEKSLVPIGNGLARRPRSTAFPRALEIAETLVSPAGPLPMSSASLAHNDLLPTPLEVVLPGTEAPIDLARIEIHRIGAARQLANLLDLGSTRREPLAVERAELASATKLTRLEHLHRSWAAHAAAGTLEAAAAGLAKSDVVVGPGAKESLRWPPTPYLGVKDFLGLGTAWQRAGDDRASATASVLTVSRAELAIAFTNVAPGRGEQFSAPLARTLRWRRNSSRQTHASLAAKLATWFRDRALTTLRTKGARQRRWHQPASSTESRFICLV